MNEQRNIFLEHKRTMLEIARANLAMEGMGHSVVIHSNTTEHIEAVPNVVNVSQMAREALADKPVSYSTEGVEDFMTWAGEVENLTEAEIAAQMAEYNRAASQAIINGKPWTLED